MIARLLCGGLTAAVLLSAPVAFADPEPPLPLPVPLPLKPFTDPLDYIISQASISNHASFSGDVCVPFGESQTAKNIQDYVVP